MQLYPLVLALKRLEYVDADTHTVGKLIRAVRDGKAHDVQRLLRLPMWPDYCIESGTRSGIASVGIAPLMLASQAGHLEVARLL
eukprot:13811721-Heterocapsa_arctica.AAC.1